MPQRREKVEGLEKLIIQKLEGEVFGPGAKYEAECRRANYQDR